MAISGPVIIVAHSGGVIMLAHWAASPGRTRKMIRGALLATPPDFETPMPEGYPTIDALANARLAAGTAPAAAISEHRRGKPQRSARPHRARGALAHDWGSRFVDLGEVGHLNPASGYGKWPQAEAFIRELASEISIEARAA